MTSTFSHGIVEHVGGHAREVDHRVRAEIADARLHVQLAVGPDRHQAVEADRAGAVRTDRHADAAHLRSVALARRAPRASFQSNSSAPRSSASFTNALVMWRRAPFGVRRAVERLALGRVHPADRHLIDAELLRGLGDHAFDDAVGLHRSRRSLLRARRRVGQHVDRAPAHRRRLIDQRRGVAGRAVIAHRPVRAAVLDDEEIERE